MPSSRRSYSRHLASLGQLQREGIAPRYIDRGQLEQTMHGAVAGDLSNMDRVRARMRDNPAAQARRVMIHRTRVRLVSTGAWVVTVQNHSSGLVTGLTVCGTRSTPTATPLDVEPRA
jgi:hypothetical protein